ncbi:MAG TPA: cation:proton antiporter [Myxococcales bacterium]|jgi:Kef-type K+ transport system membrane component KefB
MSFRQTASMLFALSLLLLVSHLLGELFKRYKQPAVVGEILTGILLGPTLFGRFSSLYTTLAKEIAPFISGFNTFAFILFLFVAGTELPIIQIKAQKSKAVWVGIAGIVLPFSLGIATAMAFPSLFVASSVHPYMSYLFFGIALTISAPPIIAKVLIDLKIIDSQIGVIGMTAGLMDDFLGWLVFGVIVSVTATGDGSWPLSWVIVGACAYMVFLFTLGKTLLYKLLAVVRPHQVLTFCVLTALCSAAITEGIGIHSFIGALAAGIVLGGSPHLRIETKGKLKDVVMGVFAPVFFAGIGLNVDFVKNFDLALCAIVLVVACAGKILGAAGAARLLGVPSRDAWAIGFAVNARGGIEIVLGAVALERGLIGAQLFVALALMAMITSLMTGTSLAFLLRKPASAAAAEDAEPSLGQTGT